MRLRLFSGEDRIGVLEVVGALVLLAFLAMAIVPGQIAPYDPLQQDIPNRLEMPTWEHLFGTDEAGRDIFSRSVYGARTSLTVALIAVITSVVVGVSLGLFSGYNGGWMDRVLGRANDLLVSFPGLIIAMALIAVIGQNFVAIGFVVGLVRIPQMFRVTRAIALKVKNLPYVDAVRSSGASSWYIMFRTILPNCSSEIFVQALLVASRAIVVEASLSFLGLGVPPPAPSWGAMLATGRNYLYQMVWYGIFPGLFIVLLVLSIQYVSRYLQRVVQ